HTLCHTHTHTHTHPTPFFSLSLSPLLFLSPSLYLSLSLSLSLSSLSLALSFLSFCRSLPRCPGINSSRWCAPRCRPSISASIQGIHQPQGEDWVWGGVGWDGGVGAWPSTLPCVRHRLRMDDNNRGAGRRVRERGTKRWSERGKEGGRERGSDGSMRAGEERRGEER